MIRRWMVVGLVACMAVATPMNGPGSRAVAAASDGLQPFFSEIGNLSLSLDAVGMLGGSGTVQIDKPADGTVRAAFLFSASTGFSEYRPSDQDVTIDGRAVAWNPAWTRSSSINSYNVAADVTELLRTTLNAAPVGISNLTVTEANTVGIDGEVLAVVWQSASARPRTIALLYGSLATGGDRFAVNLGEPLRPSSLASMSLGISFGFQPTSQYSTIKVNGSLLTSSAGGQDDGMDSDGALITVGGIGDAIGNPSDPTVLGDCGVRCDDELYDLKSLVGDGATSFTVETVNPSDNDNIFLAALDLGTTASVNRGVVLTPGSVAHDTSTSHTMVARVQDDAGATVNDGTVALTVVKGPNQGRQITGIRLPDGRVVFTYESSLTGIDELQATYTDPGGLQQVSNLVTQRWFAPVNGAFGSAWPAPDGDLVIQYSYGGEHRYLGNVFRGAENWNDTDAPVTFSQWQGGDSAIQIRVTDIYSDGDWWGLAYKSSDPIDEAFTQRTIYLNQRMLDPEGDEQRTKVATHEFGHAIGLQHTTAVSGLPKNTPSVMWQGLVGGNVRSTPQPIDVSRVDGLYS